MTSAINPNNINGQYPVAGQDNNSQGFRDNFTNTATNFQYAADEISDLQSKVVLKQALTGTTLDNNMLGSPLSNALLSNMSEATVALGTVSGSTVINYALGSYQTLTTNGAVSLSFTNLPAAGSAASVTVQVTVANVAHTLVLPAAVSVNTVGVQGLDSTTNTMEFAAVGVYSFTFTTSNGGTTISLAQVNNILTPFNFSTQQLANAGAVSLATTASYFSTVSASTATLATGADGQIKTLMMVAYGGNMVITVASAGWKTSGSGTITFNAIGDACTLQYINSKWFCIGQNSVVFA
jgi:hypothetical protein